MDTWLRLAVAVGIFILMIGLEAWVPCRTDGIDRKHRWLSNLGLAASNMLVMRITIGGLAYLAADYAQAQGIGLLNWLHVGGALALTLSLVWLDFAIYWQHVASHHIPMLWRLHRVHHSDLAIDATTAVRFHPLEIALSMVYKTLCILFIGANPLAVILFEMILNGAATFNHSNIRIPVPLEKALRWLVITPDLHRIHHSALPVETNSNYGFSIPLWDRVFGTFTAHPQLPQTTMVIGLAQFRNPHDVAFWALLKMPFKYRHTG
ncbi:MAG: sterol desaturase family protein [Methylovulum miyakonense]|uniref:sterol desaturase family protein n=1 Tax=Methylovulum miyakonense TaxID=645578 RepID=UPI003BB7E53C